MKDLTLIKTYFHRYEAEQAKSLLENNGIESIVSADDCGGFRPDLSLGMNNVRLLVRPDQAEQAKELLRILEEPYTE